MQYIQHLFSFTDTATTEIYTLSLHDALPICNYEEPSDTKRIIASRAVRHRHRCGRCATRSAVVRARRPGRSEEHTSELQSRFDLVCRLLLEKKKNKHIDSVDLDIDVTRQAAK